MFFGSDFFWLLMGVVLVLVAAAFKAFAEDQGWKLTWWKWLLSLLWYGLVWLSFYAFGTLAGENESSAGFKILLLGLFVCVILGVGLWRLLMWSPKASAPEAEVQQ